MSALFACTRCHNRHPFEDLSKAEQYCKKCLSAKQSSKSSSGSGYAVGKCTYCRGEFQLADKSSTASTCKQCSQNIKVYGQPSACGYCSVIAAFVGKHCQRCSSSKKRFGAPQNCEQCKQTCAFDMGKDQRKKTDGKILCYLCTVTFKRVLAKTKKIDWTGVSSSQNNTPNSNPDVATDTHKRKHHSHHKHKKDHHRHKHHKHHHHRHSHDHEKESSRKHKLDTDTADKDDGESPAGSKKICLEKSSSNGVEASLFDLSNTDHMVAMTQLKEENETLRKQLLVKEQSLLEKDKKLTELQASNYESEKELRGKLTKAQTEFTAKLEQVQSKNRDLQKQVASLSKGKKPAAD